MRKLTAIGLMLLTSVTFAETINPDLLVGKWQCKSESIFNNGNNKYNQISQQTFYKNGTYKSEDSIYSQNLDETLKSASKGKWYIKNNILNINIEEIPTLLTDRPTYTDVNALRTDLINNKAFNPYVINNFLPNKFSLSLTEQNQLELQGNTIDICKRIK